MLVDYTLHPVKEKIAVPSGSYWVPLHPARARLIMALLHPAAPDALIRWGLAGSIFQTTGRIGAAEYLSVPIATRMAADKSGLMQDLGLKIVLRLRPIRRRGSSGGPRAATNGRSAVNRYPVLEVSIVVTLRRRRLRR